MKILIPLEHAWIYSNPFVGILIDEFAKYKDIEILTGIDLFWNPTIHYDIIHVYWPQCLLQDEFADRSLEELREKVLNYKLKGSKIISTCLNLQAHYSSNSKLNDSYDLIYGLSDIVIHLAEHSKELLSAKYPNVNNVVIEHHIYDTLYTNKPSRVESYKRLHLKKTDKYILSFGTYRSEEEREFVFKVAKRVYKKTKYKFLIPTLYPMYESKPYKYYIKCIYYWIIMLNRRYIKYGHDYVDDLLPYYYTATEISFIQRIRILNSGNVPMGFFWGHVVVGTKDGCVGDVLRKMNNPTFEYDNIDSVVNALIKAIDLVRQGLGEENRKYVLDNCTVNKTVAQLLDLYSISEH